MLWWLYLKLKENKMTNKEYIEKNNISFSEAMKMYDNKTSCINDWLNQEYHEHKFKVGDFVIQKNDNNGIGIVIDVKDKVYLKILKRSGEFDKWLCSDECLYHKSDHEVFFMRDESEWEKIF